MSRNDSGTAVTQFDALYIVLNPLRKRVELHVVRSVIAEDDVEDQVRLSRKERKRRV